MKTKLSQRELARALDISESMVSRLKKRNMPVHSVAAAQAWRAANLDPTLLKPVRQSISTPHEASPVSEAEATRSSIAYLGAMAEHDFERWRAPLRAAMRELPHAAWPRVALPMPVWQRLAAPLLEAIGAAELERGMREGVPPDQYVSDVLYAVAAGILKLDSDGFLELGDGD